jgi:hypothetical protein
MLTLGFASATWEEDVGGPPKSESPRPFKKVLDWLFRLAAKVAKFVWSCVECAMASLALLGISKVAVGVSWVPQVSFEFPTNIHTQQQEWQRARNFLNDMLNELHQKVFSS